MPFPPIREAVKAHLDSPIKECYVFKQDRGQNGNDDDTSQEEDGDDDCPVVIFFPMVNAGFRTHKAPGRVRETDDEKEFGNFDIFDETTAYAIWRFVYPNLSYDRLTAMMEFNILNNIETIKAEIQSVMERNRKRNKKKKTATAAAAREEGAAAASSSEQLAANSRSGSGIKS